MEKLPYELVDYIYEFLTIKEMATMSLVNSAFCQQIQSNKFYSFCKEKFNTNTEVYYCELMQSYNYFRRFYSHYTNPHLYGNTLKLACVNGHLEIAKWLIKFYSNCWVDMEWIFYWTCRGGHLSIAKWLIETVPKLIEDTSNNNKMFECACEYGNLEIAKLLFEICPRIDARSNQDYAFEFACRKGFLKIAKWLIEIYPQIKFYNKESNHIFKQICANGHLAVAMWYIEIYPHVMTQEENMEIFQNAFCNW